MKEAYVKFETAQLLKQKGFSIPSDTSYEDYLWQMYNEDGKVQWGVYNSDWYFRITQQMACDWVEKTYGFFIEVWRYNDSSDGSYRYCYRIINGASKYVTNIVSDYLSKHEAIEAALQYVLTNLI